MGLFYRLADVAVMGGSLVPGVGGHNPLDAARLGVGAVTGPDMFNYTDIYGEMVAAGAALVARDARDLERALAGLPVSPEQVRAMGEHARAYAAAQTEGFEDGWRAILQLLPAP